MRYTHIWSRPINCETPCFGQRSTAIFCKVIGEGDTWHLDLTSRWVGKVKLVSTTPLWRTDVRFLAVQPHVCVLIGHQHPHFNPKHRVNKMTWASITTLIFIHREKITKGSDLLVSRKLLSTKSYKMQVIPEFCKNEHLSVFLHVCGFVSNIMSVCLSESLSLLVTVGRLVIFSCLCKSVCLSILCQIVGLSLSLSLSPISLSLSLSGLVDVRSVAFVTALPYVFCCLVFCFCVIRAVFRMWVARGPFWWGTHC